MALCWFSSAGITLAGLLSPAACAREEAGARPGKGASVSEAESMSVPEPWPEGDSGVCSTLSALLPGARTCNHRTWILGKRAITYSGDVPDTYKAADVVEQIVGLWTPCTAALKERQRTSGGALRLTAPSCAARSCTTRSMPVRLSSQ